MKFWVKSTLAIPILLVGLLAIPRGRELGWAAVRPDETVASRLAQYGPAVRARLSPAFSLAGVAYPPKAVALVGLKHEAVLEVYAGPHPDSLSFILSYPIKKASGALGPKLRQGDNQVPEGLYRVESLNPNSRFHLALRVGYPNAFDRRQAAAEGRRNLGGDIMIHGNSVSIGCLAMGDQVAEDLFVLAAETGLPGIQVILAPVDFRTRSLPPGLNLPSWAPTLYGILDGALRRLPAKPVAGAN